MNSRAKALCQGEGTPQKNGARSLMVKYPVPRERDSNAEIATSDLRLCPE